MKQVNLTASVWPEDDWYIAQCIEYDVASQGRTVEEALANLREAVELHLEEPRATVLPQIYTIGVMLDAA